MDKASEPRSANNFGNSINGGDLKKYFKRVSTFFPRKISEVFFSDTQLFEIMSLAESFLMKWLQT